MALILLAEDDTALSGLLKEALEARGHRIEQAFNGVEASEKALLLHPALIILDVQMPDLYGGAVYNMIQRQETTKGTPVIFMSGLHRDTLESILPSGPAVRVLSKPVDLKLLEETINSLLPSQATKQPTPKN